MQHLRFAGQRCRVSESRHFRSFSISALLTTSVELQTYQSTNQITNQNTYQTTYQNTYQTAHPSTHQTTYS